MKKVFTICFSICAGFAFGQSIHIYEGATDVTGDTVTVAVSSGMEAITELELHNTTADTVHYRVNRTLMNPPLESDAALFYCTGVQCYSPQTLTTWTPSTPPEKIAGMSTLPNGPGTFGISAHYTPGAVCNDLYVLYRVYKVDAGSNDTATVVFRYMCTVGINENVSAGILHNAFPNPANTMVNVKYDLMGAQKAEIVLHDMLGKKVAVYPLAANTTSAKMDISALNAGIYFYTLMVNDKPGKSQKLVISHK